MRQGDRPCQPFNASIDQAVVLSAHAHNVRDCLFNLRLVARDALAPLATRRVMGVRLDGRSMRSVLSIESVTCRAHLLHWLYQHNISRMRLIGMTRQADPFFLEPP